MASSKCSTVATSQRQPSVRGEAPCVGLSSGDVYRKAMELMWNYDLESAKQLLEPWRQSGMWHAGAYAECAALRVVLTGRRDEAAKALDLVCAAEALCKDGNRTSSSVALQVFKAEMLLLRCGLQVVMGARLRAAFNLRQCWCAYRRLERHISPEAGGAGKDVSSPTTEQESASAFLHVEDLRGRVCLGLGLFYLAASLLPAGLARLARLAGFVVCRQQGKAYLAECAERGLGPRSTLAAILLAAYHLDIEPDVRRAGDLLVASLGRQPENVLLHWAGSLLAWRNTCITQAVQMTGKALWCCGDELSDQAIYLRYELGMFRFIAMDWPEAWRHLRYVHEAVRTGAVFFPYRTVVTTQRAAVAFSLGLADEGEALCHECVASQDSLSSLRLESDFAEVLQVFLRRRVGGRQLLAFEVMYLLRQLSKVPAPMLLEIQRHLKQEFLSLRGSSVVQKGGDSTPETSTSSSTTATGAAVALPRSSQDAEGLANGGGLVEYVGAQVLHCVVLFYLGDVEQAMAFVPELSRLCTGLPQWCAYLSAHGLYWCGRVLSLSAQKAEAVRCLRQAKTHKRYPFNINTKICKVLDELEASGD